MARQRTKANAGRAATSRRRASGVAASVTNAGASGEFACPECGRTFNRAAALGAHRKRAHGIAGQSAQAKRSRSRQESQKRTPATRPTATAPRARRLTSQASARRTNQSAAVASGNGINRDALLKAIFPGGMPAREEVIRAATGWLDDAERLARMR